MLKLTPEQWQKILGFTVMDPDGWDRKGDFQTDWNKPISFNTFMDKAAESTTSPQPSREKCIQLVQNHVESWLLVWK